MELSLIHICVGALALDNALDELRRDGLHIGTVGEAGVGHDAVSYTHLDVYKRQLDCWFCRVSGIQPSSPVEEFYAEHFDNDYMANRFQTMTIHPDSSSRVDSPKPAA